MSLVKENGVIIKEFLYWAMMRMTLGQSKN